MLKNILRKNTKIENEFIINASNFTEIEEQIFYLLTKDKSIIEIADRLSLSESTVKRRIADIKVKIEKVGKQ